MTTNDLRRSYIDFFKTKDHREVKSSSLVPDDPTLLFTSAGMVQFKDQFLGIGVGDYRRAASCQKCLRTGDIENVGRTPRHLTFFEMLGNFSFGDYFKQEAIVWGWEYVRECLKIPEQDIWVSVHTSDKEAYDIWKDTVGFPAKRIVYLADNWWGPVDAQKGGVCGPDSELYLDMGGGCGGKDCKPGCDCDRFVEFWNLVFQQFDQDASGKRTLLAKPGIDTGMGLERTAAILQGVETVFKTDELRPLVKAVEEITAESKDQADIASQRMVADHLRSISFLIAEGIIPGNEGREYVLRRLIRRAARHGVRLGAEGSFLHGLVPAVVKGWGDVYAELVKGEEKIMRLLKGEEERFASILEEGTARLEELIAEAKKKKKLEIPGEEIFRLYDTYGFPDDLAEEIIAEAGLKFERQAFEKAMAGQRDKARAAWKGSGDQAVDDEFVKELSRLELPPTEFIGYQKYVEEVKVKEIIKDNGFLTEAAAGEEVALILDRTTFYAESGGQRGDKGSVSAKGAKFEVVDTQKLPGDIVVHHGKVVKGKLVRDDLVQASVDPGVRLETAANHTATHLLHQALQEVLGSHVEQAGSLVAPERLRFDFNHQAALSSREMELVEARVNEVIRMNLEVRSEEQDYKKALKSGAKAFFQDKYGDKVRLVSIGDVSLELCAGTHLQRSGEIGFFKLISQSAVAAGVRRLEAVSGAKAVEAVQRAEADTQNLAAILGVSREGIEERIKQLTEKVKSLELGEKKKRSLDLAAKSGEIVEQAREIGKTKLLAAVMENVQMNELRDLGDKLKSELKEGIIFLVGTSGKKAALLIMVTKGLLKKHPAGGLMKTAAAAMGAKGGGRPDMAQGGGDTSKLDAAFKAVEEALRE